MKKLLGILGSISLVATSGMAVVACGKSNNGEDDDSSTGTNAVLKLISEFNNEVRSKFQTMVHQPMVESSSFLTENANDFSFFNKNKLESVYGNNVGKTVFYSTLNDTDQGNFRGDVNTILEPGNKVDDLRNEMNVTRYQVLIGNYGFGFMENLIFDYENARLQYSELVDSDVEDAWIANIEMNYSIEYKYLDVNEQEVRNTLESTVIITVSNEGVIINAINDVYNSLAGNLLNTGSNIVWKDYSNLENYTSNELTKADLLTASTNNYGYALNGYYLNSDFSQGLLDEIKTTYFENTNNGLLDGITVSYADVQDYINNDFTNNIDAMGQIQYELKNAIRNGDEYWEWLNLYFGEVTTNDILEIEGNSNVIGNKQLFDNLSNGWTNTYNSYNNKFKNDYNSLTSSITANTQDQINKINISVAHEMVTIKGLQFTLGDGSYTQELSDIAIHLSVAVDNNASYATEQVNTTSQIFSAYYYGIEDSLNQIHNFYGITPTQKWDDIPSNEGNNYIFNRQLFWMDGNTGYNDFDVWTYLNNLKDDEGRIYILNSGYIPSDKFWFQHTFSLKQTVESRRARNYLIDQMAGVSDYNFIYDRNIISGGTSTFRIFNEYKYSFMSNNIVYNPGMIARARSGYNTLRWGISNDLFETFWDSETYIPSEEQNFYSYYWDANISNPNGYGSDYTFIGNPNW